MKGFNTSSPKKYNKTYLYSIRVKTRCKLWRHKEGVNVGLHSFLIWATDGQLRAPLASILRKEFQYLMDRRLCGAHGRHRLFGEEKNLLALLRIEPRIKIIAYVLQSCDWQINFPSLSDLTVAHRTCVLHADDMFSYHQISYPKIFILKFCVHFFVDN